MITTAHIKLIAYGLTSLLVVGGLWHIRHTYQRVEEQSQTIDRLAAELKSSEEARNKERALAASMATVSASYQKELRNAQVALNSAVNRLYKYKPAGYVSPASSVASRCDAAAISDHIKGYGDKLSATLQRGGESLYRDAQRADGKIEQLIAAQKLLQITAERGGPLASTCND